MNKKLIQKHPKKYKERYKKQSYKTRYIKISRSPSYLHVHLPSASLLWLAAAAESQAHRT